MEQNFFNEGHLLFLLDKTRELEEEDDNFKTMVEWLENLAVVYSDYPNSNAVKRKRDSQIKKQMYQLWTKKIALIKELKYVLITQYDARPEQEAHQPANVRLIASALIKWWVETLSEMFKMQDKKAIHAYKYWQKQKLSKSMGKNGLLAKNSFYNVPSKKDLNALFT